MGAPAPSTLTVKPADGQSCFDPDLRDFLPPSGRVVPDTPYWRRRLRDKDALETTLPATVAAIAAPAAAPAAAPQGSSNSSTADASASK